MNANWSRVCRAEYLDKCVKADKIGVKMFMMEIIKHTAENGYSIYLAFYLFIGLWLNCASYSQQKIFLWYIIY